jgi:hypothetical protein
LTRHDEVEEYLRGLILNMLDMEDLPEDDEEDEDEELDDDEGEIDE